MAGPPDHRALPASSRRPGDPSLGAAPKDGDFARLLEAASAPDAHRMAVPPEVEGWGATRPRRGTPYGPPGMVRDLAADAAARQPLQETPASTQAPAAVRDADRADGSGAAPASGGRRPPFATLPRLPLGVAGGAGRPRRDRVVPVLFALAGLWILLGVIDTAARSGGQDLGVLFVLAVVAFFVVRGWIRSRRPPTGPR